MATGFEPAGLACRFFYGIEGRVLARGPVPLTRYKAAWLEPDHRFAAHFPPWVRAGGGCDLTEISALGALEPYGFGL